MRNTPIEQGVDYLEILDLSGQFPGIREAQRLRVEIERTGGGDASFWALLTATNNQTQHVTIFTPE